MALLPRAVPSDSGTLPRHSPGQEGMVAMMFGYGEGGARNALPGAACMTGPAGRTPASSSMSGSRGQIDAAEYQSLRERIGAGDDHAPAGAGTQ
jgi:hypothetical protein